MSEEESKPKPSGKKFKASQLSFNLPKEIQGEFERHLEHAKNLEEEANLKLQEAHEKEELLEKTRQTLEAENIEIREKLQAQLDALKKTAESEKNILISENERLTEELKKTIAQSEELRDQKIKLLGDLQKDKKLFEEVDLKRGKDFKENVSLMAQKFKALAIEENETAIRKEKSIGKVKIAENKLKKIIEIQTQNIKKLQVGLKTIQLDRKKQKARSDEEFKDRKSELEQEFKDKSTYFTRRKKELEAEEDLIQQMRADVKNKERSLSIEAQKRSDKRLKKKIEELEKRDKAFADREAALIKQEESVKQQRQKMMTILQIPKGAKYAVAQLVSYADEEGLILKRKKEYLKSFKNMRPKMEKEFKARLVIYEEEKEKLLSQLESERQKILDYKADISKKEKELFKRESKEIAQLNEDYEDFKTSLEITQMENESILDEKKKAIEEREKKLLEKEEEIINKEKENVENYLELEKQSLDEIKEIQAIKVKAQENQEELSKFFSRNQTTFQKRLDFQNNEYKKFQKKLETVLKEAQEMGKFLSESGNSFRKNKEDSERAREERLEEKDRLLQSMEQELKQKLDEYQNFVDEMKGAKKELLNKDKIRNEEFMENLSHIQNKLSDLGESYEDLSETFKKEKESGVIEVIADDDSPKYKTRIAKDGDISKLEWPLAVKYKLDPDSMEVDESMLVDYLDDASGKYEEWISIPPGECWSTPIGSYSSKKLQKIEIKKPLMISKYPVTNALFYRFTLDTNYKTEAERTVRGIVYQNGVHVERDTKGKIIRQSYSNPSMDPVQTANWFRPDGTPESLFDKYNHPVTQITFSDAVKFCDWKTEMLGKKIRLPNESEWEYIATNLGEIRPGNFAENEALINFEGTGIGSTTPVDYFHEQNSILGIHDLFGNVYEWVVESQEKKIFQRSKLEYKVVKGGSFMTHLEEIAPWNRLSFAKNYCASFLGFRLVCEAD